MKILDKLLKGNIKYSDDEIIAMASGNIVDVSKVSDKVFASKMMGDTIAFQYEQNTVTICAPANGELCVLFPTGHAFGVKMKNGTELLVHIGINTVNANGNGFHVSNKKQGDFVKAGEKIVEVDLKKLNSEYDMTTMLIITNPNGNKYKFIESKTVEQGEKIIV